MAAKAPGKEPLVVEFASDPPPLNPGAARAVLEMLLSAREKQAAEDQETDPGDSNPPARRGREASQPHGLVTGPLSEPDTNPHAPDLGIRASKILAPWHIRRSEHDHLCPRGDSPLTYMPALTSELILGAQR